MTKCCAPIALRFIAMMKDLPPLTPTLKVQSSTSTSKRINEQMRPVLIAGGGVGGLTLALALAKNGHTSRVFESRSQPPREGAGIQLGPNATKIIGAIGLSEALQPHIVQPECIVVHDGVTGRELTRLPLGSWLAGRHGSPYWVVHRAALHEVLWSAAQSSPLITLETDRSVKAVNEDGEAKTVTIRFGDGHVAAGDILVGADGLWSNVRRHVNPGFKLEYTGLTAARTVVPRAALEGRFLEPVTGVWLSPRAHVVHYPINAGRDLAIVAIAARDAVTKDWADCVSAAIIAERFKTMPRVLLTLFESAAEWRQWGLFRAAGDTHWHDARCILIGDAAHPILPFLAQGGAMAIEDGFELAEALAARPPDLSQTLQHFTQRRRQRVMRVQQASAANGKAYHLSGVAALARNVALSSLPGATFMKRYDWIYGH